MYLYKSITRNRKQTVDAMLYLFLVSSMPVLAGALLYPPEELGLIVSSKKCIASIAETYFVERPTVSVYTTDILRDSTVLEGLYQSRKHDKKFVNFNTFIVKFKEVRKEYSVIVAEHLDDLILPKQLDKLALWNARSKYIFYSFTNGDNSLQRFVEAVWNYYIINAIVLMPSIENETILNIFTWFPYSEDNCGASISPVQIDTCSYGNLQTNTNLFPNKVPLDLHGCPVRIRAIIWPPFVLPPDNDIILDNTILNITQGIDVTITKAIARAANFTIQISSTTIPHDWGMATVDGNATGTIKVLREKGADIGIGSFGPAIGRRMYCDYTVSHVMSAESWCVPIAQNAPRWKNLLRPFQITAWLSMILTYFLVSFIVWGLCYCPPKDTSIYNNPNNSLIYVFSAFLGLSAHKTPNKLSSRISFIFWLFFSIHFIVAYQAKLISVLLRPSYEQQISTIEDILQSKIEFKLLPTLRRFYENTGDWRDIKVIADWKNCDDSDACLKRVAYNRDLALCTSKEHALFEALKYRNADGQPLVYCFDYISFNCEFYMTKGYPLKARIDKLIYRVLNSGLLFKWQRDLDYIWLYKYRNTLPIDKGNDQRLTIEGMQGAFGVLVVGLTFALLIFILELVYMKLMKTKLMVDNKAHRKLY